MESWAPSLDWDGAFRVGFVVVLLLAIPFLANSLLDLPSEKDVEAWERAFLESLPGNTGPVLGVIFSDSTLALSGRLGFEVRRLVVVERHRRRSDDTVIYRSRENPNDFPDEENVTALLRWIDAAQDHRAPAAYYIRTGYGSQPLFVQRLFRAWDIFCGRRLQAAGLYVLPPEQIALIRRDPRLYLAKFNDHISKGAPLPHSYERFLRESEEAG